MKRSFKIAIICILEESNFNFCSFSNVFVMIVRTDSVIESGNPEAKSESFYY